MSVVIQLTVDEQAALREVAGGLSSNAAQATAFPSWIVSAVRAVAGRLPTEPRCPHQLHLSTGTVRCELLADEPHQHRATTGQGVRVAWDEPQEGPPECRQGGPGGYICSEPKGHAGQHVARGLDGRAVAGWNSP